MQLIEMKNVCRWAIIHLCHTDDIWRINHMTYCVNWDETKKSKVCIHVYKCIHLLMLNSVYVLCVTGSQQVVPDSGQPTRSVQKHRTVQQHLERNPRGQYDQPGRHEWGLQRQRERRVLSHDERNTGEELWFSCLALWAVLQYSGLRFLLLTLFCSFFILLLALDLFSPPDHKLPTVLCSGPNPQLSPLSFKMSFAKSPAHYSLSMISTLWSLQIRVVPPALL